MLSCTSQSIEVRDQPACFVFYCNNICKIGIDKKIKIGHTALLRKTGCF